jgi:hypothetical protein
LPANSPASNPGFKPVLPHASSLNQLSSSPYYRKSVAGFADVIAGRRLLDLFDFVSGRI